MRPRARISCATAAALCAALLVTSPARAAGEEVELPFRQVGSPTRIGARFSAIAVDPSDPGRVWVGTEEGTVARSSDGGATWDEVDIAPSLTTRFGTKAPIIGKARRPSPGSVSGASDVLVGPEVPTGAAPDDRVHASSIQILDRTYQRTPLAGPWLKAPGVSATLFERNEDPTLLASAAATAPESARRPVVALAVCPGGAQELLVAARGEVLGSNDGGESFLRLFAIGSQAAITGVACSPRDPNDITTSSSEGAYRSRDGGGTFDPISMPAGVDATTAVAYAESGELIVGGAREVWTVGPEGGAAARPLGDARVATSARIQWIAAGRAGRVWAATTDGASTSADAGESFSVVSGLGVDRGSLVHVMVGAHGDAGERVVVVSGEHAWASDDDGRTWMPFFGGETRRTIRQVATSKGVWWVVTRGDLWTTAVNESPSTGTTRARAWAKSRLEREPSLGVVSATALARAGLLPSDVGRLRLAYRSRHWLPRVDLRFERVQVSSVVSARESLSTTTVTEATSSTRALAAYGFLTWTLPDTLSAVDDISKVERELQALRRRLSFAVEDAWREKQLHLTRLASGQVDELQLAVLVARIEGLDALLHAWTGIDNHQGTL